MKILKFTADWCPTCKSMSKIIEDIPTKDIITEVNIETDEGDDLSSKFKIKSLPTLVIVDENEKEIERYNGSLSRVQLEDIISKYERN